MFNKILPMTGVEPRTSGIEIDRSTNWATTTASTLMTEQYHSLRPMVTFGQLLEKFGYYFFQYVVALVQENIKINLFIS